MHDIHHIDALALRNQWMNKKHPLVKLIVTIVYIAVTVSFSRYDLFGLLGMAVYIIAGYMLAELSITDTFRRLFLIIPAVLILGSANIILDRHIVLIGTAAVRGGVVSAAVLVLKSIFTVLAAYLLAATSGIEKICFALEMLHIPDIIINQIMLMYRYIFMMLGEVSRISQAYSLRAPDQKGIDIKAWGPLSGGMLLRSMDRAERVYESMQLRGFSGSYSYMSEQCRISSADIMYLVFWLMIIAAVRLFPIVIIAGDLISAVL